MFLAGDTFKVDRNGFTGEIVKVQGDEYTVKWANYEGLHTYGGPDATRWWTNTSSCQHQMGEYVGFRESYLYCTKCEKRSF